MVEALLLSHSCYLQEIKQIQNTDHLIYFLSSILRRKKNVFTVKLPGQQWVGRWGFYSTEHFWMSLCFTSINLYL